MHRPLTPAAVVNPFAIAVIMRFRRSGFIPSLLSLWMTLLPAAATAQSIDVPNGSFETPATLFAGVFLDAWEKFPKPDDYDESGPFTWDQLAGTFKNTPPGSFDHIINCDGSQAAFLFAVPGVGIFQDYTSQDWDDPEPSHRFDVRYEPGTAYRLTAGIIGGGGNMREGVTLTLGLYYRNDSDQVVLVGTTTITNTPDLTPGRTNLTDFTVLIPVVQPTDAWAGRHMGIQIWSTVSPDLAGGYWDVENVRLEAFPPDNLVLQFAVDGDTLVITWPSRVDHFYQVEVSSDLSAWTPLGSAQTGTGATLSARIPMTGSQPALFRVTVLPPI